MWTVLKKLVRGKECKNGSIEIEGCTTNYESACSLNDHFVSVGAKLADKIPVGNETVIPEILNPGLEFNLTEVSQDQVFEELKGIKCSKATGLDGLNARLLKSACREIALPITHIINLSIMTGVFPNSWKQAKVTPLFKEGDKKDVNNYRPISVLPVLGKILECLVHDQIYTCIVNAHLFHPAQSGFRKMHSTST